MTLPTHAPVAARPDPTRQRLLEAALARFTVAGYAGTSVRDLAEDLGISKAAVHYHFPAKEQIVAALLDPLVARLQELVADAERAERREPERVLGRLVDLVHDAGAVMDLLATDPSCTEADPGVKERSQSLFDRLAAVLAGPTGSSASAGSDDLRGPQLRAQASFAVVVFHRQAVAHVVPPLGWERERELVLAAALAALGASGGGFVRLGVPDAGEVLTLQRAAYLEQARLHGDDLAMPPLTETLSDVREALDAGTVLGLREHGRLVAAGRVRRDAADPEVALVGRLAVAPDRQGEGLGSGLLAALEGALPGVREVRLFTGEASAANLRLYARLGYQETGRSPAGGYDLVHLTKAL